MGLNEATVMIIGMVLTGLIYALKKESNLNLIDQRLTKLEKESDELHIKIDTMDSKFLNEVTQIKISLAEIKATLNNYFKGERNG
jgi:hypothetical protein